MIQFPLVILSITFIFLLAILLKLRSRRRSLAIPEGQEVYQDLPGKGRILRSVELGISGKPDMIVRKGRTIIPYEYKSTNASSPRDGHLYQMFAYFAILEENYPGQSIPYGILKYRETAFKVHNSSENRWKLLSILDEMRNSDRHAIRNHNNRGKCFRCSFREVCRQSLIKPSGNPQQDDSHPRT